MPRVRVRQLQGAPVVAVRVWLPGGVRAESIPGQALIAGRLLAEGTKRRSWQRISEEAEARGCSIVTTAGYSVQGVGLDGLADDWERIVEWAVELTFEAGFHEARCEWLCLQATAELESMADLPEVVTGWAFLQLLYPDHPLGRPLQGTLEGLASLTGRDCASFHRSCLRRGPLIVITGEIDPEEVSTRLADLVEQPAGAPGEWFEVADPKPPVESIRRIALAPGEQAHLNIGGLTVRRSDSDFEAMQLLGVILGSGSGLIGRIPQRIREDEGLAYGCEVESVAGAGVDRGRLVVSLSTSISNLDRAVSVVREELERVYEQSVSEEEVEAARSYLLGREPFHRETARQWAVLELEAMFWNLPVNDPHWLRKRLEAVRPEDVGEAARRHLEPGNLVETAGVPS